MIVTSSAAPVTKGQSTYLHSKTLAWIAAPRKPLRNFLARKLILNLCWKFRIESSQLSKSFVYTKPTGQKIFHVRWQWGLVKMIVTSDHLGKKWYRFCWANKSGAKLIWIISRCKQFYQANVIHIVKLIYNFLLSGFQK